MWSGVMTQLFPGKTITTVSYGTNDDGYPIVLVATDDGDIVILQGDGYMVYPEFRITTGVKDVHSV
jgi:hypothetical protein